MGATLKPELRFHGLVAKLSIDTHPVFLLQPSTYMNLSGRAVHALVQFYRIPIENILIIHDELDFPVGQVRLKKGGGHGGHNGLRHIIQQLASHQFYRIRLGIGHPGHRDLVQDYVLGKPSTHDRLQMNAAIERFCSALPSLLHERIDETVRLLAE